MFRVAFYLPSRMEDVTYSISFQFFSFYFGGGGVLNCVALIMTKSFVVDRSYERLSSNYIITDKMSFSDVYRQHFLLIRPTELPANGLALRLHAYPYRNTQEDSLGDTM